MKSRLMLKQIACMLVAVTAACINLKAQNPFIKNQFTADPSARVFGDRIYVYPSHDIPCTASKGRIGWFCMEDYHVFSSANLSDWTDHGMIVTQNNVPWVKPESYAMWAPDCIYRNGKYYFYFPATPADTTNGRSFNIGVAIADKPEGPFVPMATSIKKVKGIDPNVFIDKDGQAYLYWSQGNIYGAKLKENMIDLDGDPLTLGKLPEKGLKEGPYLFERNGVYYMTYPHVENKTERIEYATSSSPLGPFAFRGVIMDESPTGCWTNHHSILQFNNQWYFFYHHNDYSPSFDKNRSIRMDSLFFEADGSIRKVVPTLRGVGLTAAAKEIQLDRYSAISTAGVSISFLDTTNKFLGWKTDLQSDAGWVQYNSVDFRGGKNTFVKAKAFSSTGAELEIRSGSPNGKLLGTIRVKSGSDWQVVESKITQPPVGIQNLFIKLKGTGQASIDWISFR